MTTTTTLDAEFTVTILAAACDAYDALAHAAYNDSGVREAREALRVACAARNVDAVHGAFAWAVYAVDVVHLRRHDADAFAAAVAVADDAWKRRGGHRRRPSKSPKG